MVWGGGNTHAKIMLIGEAPGKEESEQGKPFVGRAGKKLRGILSGFLDLDKDIYITNTVLCRPPDNRNPSIDEQNTCFPHIETQIRIIRPRLVMTAGRVSSDWFSRFVHLTYIVYQMQEWKLDDMYALWLPLYHPSYLLRGGGVQHKHYSRVKEDFELAKFIWEDKQNG